MFKGLGNLGNLAGLMKQAQEVGTRMKGLEAELKMRRHEGTSGGGMVKVEVNGSGEVVQLAIASELVANNEREMLEDLIPAAVNQAMAAMREARAEAMRDIIPDVDLPGLPNMSDLVTQFTKSD